MNGVLDFDDILLKMCIDGTRVGYMVDLCREDGGGRMSVV